MNTVTDTFSDTSSDTASDTTLRRTGAPTRSTRLVGSLVALALAAVLSSCSDDPADETATDPAGSSTSSPTETTGTPTETPTESPDASEGAEGTNGPIEVVGGAGITEAQLVSRTEGGGSVSELAFALDTEQAVADFVVGMQNGLGTTVSETVEQVREAVPDATPYGAVVATGCDAPRDVAIEAGEAGFTVVPSLPKSGVQCLAPVTFVVVFAAPNA